MRKRIEENNVHPERRCVKDDFAFRTFLQLLHKRSGWKYEISCKLLITSGYCTRNTLARKRGELFGAWPWRNRVTRAAET